MTFSSKLTLPLAEPIWESTALRDQRPSATRRREHFTGIAAAAGFDAVVCAHDALFAARFLPNPALDTAMREAWRFQILTVAIHLHDTRDPADPRAGLTVGRLQHVLANRSLASAGRIAAILKQMEAAGHFSATESPVDRRVVLLTPTDTLDRAIRLWEKVIFSLIEMTAPDSSFLSLADTNPAFGRAMRRHMVTGRLAGWSPLDGFPDIALFATRDGGWRLLSRMAAMRLSRDHSAVDTPMEIDLQAFARETGTSRSSLRRLLEDAWAAGLLDGPPRNGRSLLPSSALVASFSTWLAMFIDAHRSFAEAAREDLHEGADA